MVRVVCIVQVGSVVQVAQVVQVVKVVRMVNLDDMRSENICSTWITIRLLRKVEMSRT